MIYDHSVLRVPGLIVNSIHSGPDFRPEERQLSVAKLPGRRAVAVKWRTRMLALLANCYIQGVLLGNSRRITGLCTADLLLRDRHSTLPPPG